MQHKRLNLNYNDGRGTRDVYTVTDRGDYIEQRRGAIAEHRTTVNNQTSLIFFSFFFIFYRSIPRLQLTPSSALTSLLMRLGLRIGRGRCLRMLWWLLPGQHGAPSWTACSHGTGASHLQLPSGTIVRLLLLLPRSLCMRGYQPPHHPPLHDSGQFVEGSLRPVLGVVTLRCPRWEPSLPRPL